MSDENKRSKYIREGNEPVLKHMRAKGEKPASKYIRSKDEKNENEKLSKGEYRKSVMTPKRARELMLEEEEAEKLLDENETAEETAEVEVKEVEPEVIKAPPEEEFIPEEEPVEEEGYVHEKSKGSARDIFREKERNDEQAAFYKREETKKSFKYDKGQAIAREALCLIVLAAFAILLQKGEFPVKHFPDFLRIDFSVLPELIASIAYGPLFGVIICVLKNLVIIFFDSSKTVSCLTNLLLNSVFVFIAGLIYSRSLFSGDKKVDKSKQIKRKGYRRRRIFLSSFIGMFINIIPQFLITRYLAYPIIISANKLEGFSFFTNRYVQSYNELSEIIPLFGKIVPKVTSVSWGIVDFNIPITFVKLFIVTVLVAFSYKYISPFLHYRKKNKKKAKKRGK